MNTQSYSRVVGRARVRRSLPSPEDRAELRLRLGLTQEEIASLLGTTRAAVSRYELGTRRPRAAIAERYAHLLERLAQEAR